MIKPKTNKRGVSIVEVLVVVGILLVAFVGILGLLTFSLQVSNLIKETTQANFLAQDAIEAIRNFRDGTTWDTDGLRILSAGTEYHPEKTGDVPSKWMMATGEETIDGFSRKIVFEQIKRDAQDNIVENGGINDPDPDTRKATITVSWKDKEIEIITYFTNWR